MLRINTQFRKIQHRNIIHSAHIFLFHPVYNHTNGTGVIGDRVDKDERSTGFVLLIRIKEQLFRCSQYHTGYLIQRKERHGKLLHSVHVHLVLDAINAGTAHISSLLDKEGFVHIHWFLIHPYQHSLKVTINDRQIIGMHQHLSSRYIYFIFQCQCDRLRWKSIIQLSVIGHNTFHAGSLAGRQRHYFVSFADNPRSHFSTEATKIEIRTKHVLYGETKIGQVMVVIDVHRFEEVEQGDTLIPGSTL